MLTLLHSAVVQTIVLAYLLLALCGPFVLAWFVWRCMRDLHRIADAQQHIARASDAVRQEAEVRERLLDREDTRRVANSMFAR
jgi:threonine/homoserine/homoserine lactone efflux protein